MSQILSGTTNIITNMNYVISLINESKNFGLNKTSIDGKFLDDEKINVLISQGYNVTTRYNDMGTYPTYDITWITNSSELMIQDVDYILFLNPTGETITSSITKRTALFIINGESNSGGYALNSQAPSNEIGIRNEIKILNNN